MLGFTPRVSGLLAVAGTLALGGACAKQTEFACADDSDCVRGGEAGLCQPTDHCSYEDETCASGYRYPAGAPEQFAGLCAGEGRETEPSTTSDGTAGESSGDASTGAIPTSTEEGSTTQPTTATTTTTTTGATTESESTETSSGMCMQLDAEPNDDRASAIPLPAKCTQTIRGTLATGDLVDYFEVNPVGCDPQAEGEITISGGEELRWCYEIPCEGGDFACTGDLIMDKGFSRCCALGDSIIVTTSCDPKGGALGGYLLVAGRETCRTYDVELNF